MHASVEMSTKNKLPLAFTIPEENRYQTSYDYKLSWTWLYMCIEDNIEISPLEFIAYPAECHILEKQNLTKRQDTELKIKNPIN